VSPSVIRVIKSMRMRWTGHVASIRKMRKAYTILVGNLKGRDQAEDLSVDRKIIL